MCGRGEQYCSDVVCGAVVGEVRGVAGGDTGVRRAVGLVVELTEDLLETIWGECVPLYYFLVFVNTLHGTTGCELALICISGWVVDF